MAGTDWALLPSVLIVEILSYISRLDRLKASSVCKRWRSCLFHPLLWKRITFEANSNKREKSRFLSNACGRFVRECVIKFNSHGVDEVKECLRILRILSQNKNLQVLCVEPSGCHTEWPDNNSCSRFLTYVEDIIGVSRQLKHFSLGCVEEVMEHSDSILNKLLSCHSNSLEGLYLASVKEDSENYGIIELDTHKLHRFQNLKQLSIDYDFLDNQTLQAFVHSGRRGLRTIIIHVHGIDPEHEKLTNRTWGQLTNHCKDLSVTLNLVHSYTGVDSLLDILHPNMPLAHYRQFFCGSVNTAAISLMAQHYCESLESIRIVDGCPHPDSPNTYDDTAPEDPFVMLAWKCPKLENFTLIGYEIEDYNVTAIARLRGNNLKCLTIPLKCISTYNSVSEEHSLADEGSPSSRIYVKPAFSEKISSCLGFSWKPLLDSEVPAAVYDEAADAELAYMDILLKDQSYTDLS